MKRTAIHIMLFMLILLVAALAYAADKETKPHHKTAGVACVDCHGTDNPTASATEESCLSCHGSREDLTKSTEKLEANPHFGHEDGLTCDSCHKEHMPSILYCDDCHKWDLVTP